MTERERQRQRERDNEKVTGERQTDRQTDRQSTGFNKGDAEGTTRILFVFDVCTCMFCFIFVYGLNL